ncbi:MAG: hypothetical protein PF961_23810, partial [Planctomycetota bacterium]|nr:hypothetical protein [Planctomycetota bacterium]
MRTLLLFLCALGLMAAEVSTIQADNLPWNAAADSNDLEPIIGLAGDAERYTTNLVPLHSPPEAAPSADSIPWASHDALLVSCGSNPPGFIAMAATAINTEGD